VSTPDPAAEQLAADLGGTVADPAAADAADAVARLAAWNRTAYARSEITAIWTAGTAFPACRARWLLDEISRGRAVHWVAAYSRRPREPWRTSTAPTAEQLAAWAEPCPVLPWWWSPPGPAHGGAACDCTEPGPAAAVAPAAAVYGTTSEHPGPPASEHPGPAPPAWTVEGHAVDLRGGVLTVDGRQVARDVIPADITLYARRLFVGGRPVADLAAALPGS
jgi:hypothetical protein